MKKFTFLLFCWGTFFPTFAQSPTDLNSDIAASAGFSTVANIEASFNNARRQEEMQLNLPTNSIKNLDLPDQTTWNNFSDDQKMLFLLNDERTARAGINYGAGAVKGLPFQGVEKKVDDVAQTYATLNYTNNRFDHNLNGSPWDRIDNALTTACRTFNNFAENLAIAGGSFNSGFPEAVAQAVYLWNYEDALSQWGHRRMNLSQGFTDDNGDANQEGFIGVGVHRGGAYNGNPADFGGMPFNFSFGVITVLNYYDPVADANAGACNYNVTVSTNNLGGGGGGSCGITNLTAGNPTCAVDGNTYSVMVTWTGNDASVTINGGTGASPASASGATGTSATFTYPHTQNAASITVTDSESQCSFGPFNITKPANCSPGSTGCTGTDLTATGPTITGNHIASGTITTSGTVATTGTTLFQAATSITLNQGFTAMPNFTALIGNCGGGTGTAAGTCADPIVLTCGTPYSGNTTGGENSFPTYRDPNFIYSDYTGLEKIHTLVVPANSNRIVNLTGLSVDLDLFAGISCSATVLGASRKDGTAAEGLNLGNNQATPFTFYIIVDGWNGAIGPYTLSCANPLNDELVETSSIILPNNQIGESPLLEIERNPTNQFTISPNPFNSETNFQFNLNADGPVDILVYNMSGQLVAAVAKQQRMSKGFNQVTFQADALEEGMYLVVMRADETVQTKKMIIVK